ncbi:MAG TPA: nucleotidyltransferase family protein [Pyrinomonadaceae bacterium]|nr:nucleotidyltransferase family protein [Pyrinomonadaceae bacterium]
MSSKTEVSVTTKAARARPEHELLLCCARVRAGEEVRERIVGLVRQNLDWEYLSQLAKRHAVLPLLYRQLDASAAAEVPAAPLERLRAKFRDNAARNLYLTGELERIITLFKAEGVEVLPYKGPALAAAAYGQISLRRFVDLDILVGKRDIPRAKELLRARGFRPTLDLSPAQERLLLRAQHNLPFARDGGRLLVELHWEVASKQFAPASFGEGFGVGRETVKLLNLEVESLSPEDLLLSLCVHGTKHLWERLAWICDLAELVRSRPRMDWQALSERARKLRAERMLNLGLRLALELLDAPLPDEVKRRVKADAAAGELAARVRERLFDDEYGPAGLLQSMSFNLRARRDWRDKARYLGFIFTPTDGDLGALRLPAALTFVYYLVRPFRLLLKGGGVE